MRTGAACGLAGNLHEAGFYRSDDEFRALIVPFVEEGVAAGEPVVIGYDTRKVRLLRSWLARPSDVTFLVDTSLYATPAAAIENYRQLFERHLATGAQQIRIAGDVPHPGNGGRFDGWDRYESAVNAVWQDYPVWSRCLYDATTAPDEVRDVVERTHPRLVSPAGTTTVSRRYEDIRGFRRLPAPVDPREASIPLVKLIDPSPAAARLGLLQAARGCTTSGVLEDLQIGVTECVANAQLYGRTPTTVKVWAAPGRVVVHVHDTGPGPDDPLVGLVPFADSAAGPGLGLWLTHKLDLDVALISAPDGFTVRLRGGGTISAAPAGAEATGSAVLSAPDAAPRGPALDPVRETVRTECTVGRSRNGLWRVSLTLTWNRTQPEDLEIVVSAEPPHPALPVGQWVIRRGTLAIGVHRPVADDNVRVEPDADGELVRLRLAEPNATFDLPVAWLRAFLDRLPE